MEIIEQMLYIVCSNIASALKTTARLWVTVITLLGAGILSAQSPFIWAREGVNPPNPSSNNEGEAVAVDPSGNVFATGYFTTSSTSFGPYTLNNPNPGVPKIYLVKYDSAGNELWARTITGEVASFGYSLAADDSGNVYLAGRYNGGTSIIFAPLTVANTNAPKFFLAKYDANGNALWVQSMGQQYTSHGHAVAVDRNSGAVYFAGSSFDTTVVFDSITVTNPYPGQQEVYLARYSTTGHPLWVRHFGSNNATRAAALAVDSAGDVYVTGNFKGVSLVIGSDTLMNAGSNNEDVYVSKFSSAGISLWSERYGDTGPDFSSALCTDQYNHVFLGGNYYSSSLTLGPNTFTNNGAPDCFFARMDATNGSVDWSVASGAGLLERIYSACTTPDGHVFFTGGFDIGFVQWPYSISFGSTTLSVIAGSEDPSFIIEMDTAMNIVHSVVLQTGGDDMLAIADDPLSTCIYISGDAQNNPWIFGTDTLYGGLNSGEYIMTAKLNLENDGLYLISGSTNATDCANPCSGALSAYVMGGTPPYSYLWLPGNYATDTVSGVCAGTYTLIVTDQAGDTLTSQQTVTYISNGPSLSFTVTPVSCFSNCDGSYVAMITGGTSPYAVFPSLVGTNLCPGNYPVTVTDVNGCTDTDTAVVTGPVQLTGFLNVTDASCSSCADGSITCIPSGGTPPYTFSWPPSSSSGATVTNLTPGSYMCCIMDSAGCEICITDTVDFFNGLVSSGQPVFRLYHNPAYDVLQISIPAELKNVEFSLYSADGKLCHTATLNESTQIDVSAWPRGFYLAQLHAESVIFRQKLILR